MISKADIHNAKPSVDNKILVIDIETTGFLNQGGSIVEIGIVQLDLSNGQITTVYDSLLKEDIFSEKHMLPPFGWIFENSDLTAEDLKNAPDAKDVLDEVQSILNEYPLGCTAYNKRFDFGFLCDRGLEIKELPCPMILSTEICRLPKRNGYAGYKWPSVQEAFEYFFPDVEYTERHRGADDAHHEAMIVYELFKRGAFKVDGFKKEKV